MSAIQTVVKVAQQAIASRAAKQAVIVGVSGCQGSGKTYTSHGAVAELRQLGFRAIAISIDDYYLDHEQQQQLARKGNPLLAKRGLPGTHSVDTLKQTLATLLKGEGAEILQYDKSKFAGEGDRAPPVTTEAVDVVILEGWMIGFTARTDLETAYESSPHAKIFGFEAVQQVNTLLESYSEVWSMLSSLVLLKAHDLSYVYKWRLEQEHAMIKAKGVGMTDAQVKAFVDGYMPAYELYLATIQPNVILEFNDQRQILNYN